MTDVNLAHVEMGLLGNVATQEHVRQIELAGLYFSVYAGVFDVIRNYIAQYDGPPSVAIITAQQPGWQQLDGPFEHWLVLWLTKRKRFAAQKIVADALDKLARGIGDPDQIVGAIAESHRQISVLDGIPVHNTDSGISERYALYQRRVEMYRERNGLILWGIPTGLSIIDGSHEGWMPGELIGFYARPTVGKTWVLLWQGVTAWLAGKRVLLISPELPPSQIAIRIDALIAGQLGLAFSHRKARSGNPDVDGVYQQLTAHISQQERWWTVGDIAGREVRVSDIAELIARHQPDLVLVDGVSLLGDERRTNSEWELMKRICYDLKRLATHAEIAVICSHQAVNKARGRRGSTSVAQGRGDDWALPTLNDAAYGDAFVQAMSTVFTMAPDQELSTIRWYSLRKSRERDIDFVPRMALAWDVDAGRIVDLGRYGDDINMIGAELQAMGIKPRIFAPNGTSKEAVPAR